jgi:glucose-1-phosphate thymidylyltransferase
MLDANRLILDDLTERIEGELVDSRVEGRVVIEPGARLERTNVRGPAVIGAGARLVDAYIGPYTAVGKGVVIERAELEHSIVLEGSSIRDLEGRIEASLIGRNVAIARSPDMPKAYRFVVGDNAEIAIL